jgi:hypothetical protein
MCQIEEIKGNVVQLHAMDGIGGGEVYRWYAFSASALEGGEWSASRPGRALPPQERQPISIGQEAGRAPQSVWTQRVEEKSPYDGDRTLAVSS